MPIPLPKGVTKLSTSLNQACLFNNKQAEA